MGLGCTAVQSEYWNEEKISEKQETKPGNINDIQVKQKWMECVIPDAKKPTILFELRFFVQK